MRLVKQLQMALIQRRYKKGCSSLGRTMYELSKARKALKNYQAQHQDDEFAYSNVFLDEIYRHLMAAERIIYLRRPAKSLNDAFAQIKEINETCQY